MEDPTTSGRLLANQKQARYFDGAVDLFDQKQPRHILERLERIVSAAGIQHGETVLDVGAGVGVLVPMIRAYDPGRILACDLSERMLTRLKQKFPDVETILEDVCDLALPDGSVDVIFMNAVFPNIVDKPAALNNCCRMLRPGGRLLISHPEGSLFVDKLREIVPFSLDPLPTSEQLQRLIRPVALKLVRYVDRDDLFLAVIRRENRS